MIKNRLIDYSFVVLLIGLFLVTYFLIMIKNINYVFPASITMLGCALIVLILSYLKTAENTPFFKWLNFLTNFVYYIVAISFASAFLMFSQFEDEIFPLESSILLFTSFVSFSTLSFYMENNSVLIKNILKLVFFTLVIFISFSASISLSLPDLDYYLDNISRPLYSAFLNLGMACNIFIILKNFKNINSKIIKFIYGTVVVFFVLGCCAITFILVSGKLPQPYETSIILSVIIYVFAILISFLSIKKLYSS